MEKTGALSRRFSIQYRYDNQYIMKPSEITASLQSVLAAKLPVFIWGPPGVGKSQIVAQIAQANNLELRDIRALLLDPVDLRGLPRITDKGLSQWCTPEFLPREGKGILFLDELNAAPPLVQAACYQLVLDRKLGEYTLPEEWTVIAAGNRETDRAVTHRMPSALANRFIHFDFSVDTNEWIAWAAGNDIAEEIIAFIRFRPALLHDFDPEKNTRAFPTPRSWEFASTLLAAGTEPKLLKQVLSGTVGSAAAAEFIGFLKLYRNLPEVEEIMQAPESIDIPVEPAVLFAVCEMVGRAATMPRVEKVFLFAARLPTEFAILLVRESVRHCREIAATDLFAGWAARHAEVLV